LIVKITYVLVSNGQDRYASMCYLSAAAVRRLHADARIVLVTDEATEPLVRAKAPYLREVVDEFLIEAARMPEPRARSFYLKTRLRDIVTGDFIYLDSDTLPIRPFFDMAEGDWDVAFVQDRTHHGPIMPVYPHWELPRLQKMGWQAKLSRYFNAGIGFYRDNPRVRALSSDWQARWLHSYSLGDDWDQLALNCSLEAVPVRVHELSPRYNAMVTVSPVHAIGAKIYHFFAGNCVALEHSLYEHLIRRFEVTGAIDWAAVDFCVRRNHPWMPPYWPRRLWQTGNRAEAIRLAVANLPSRLSRSLSGRRADAPQGVTAR
jgi:hypothetical protein